MSYSDNMIEMVFKTSATGQRIYYPFGAFGRGRILSSEREEKKLKKILFWGVIILSPAAFFILRANSSFMVKFFLISALFTVANTISYLPVRGNQISDERITFSELWQRSWRDLVYGSGRNFLWFFFLVCVILAVIGVAAVFIGHGNLWPRLALLGGSVLSAASSLALLLKTRQAGR
ncbi:hypothetical protein [Azospirillum brasilense]|uniref:hypothetical protein n=1 Tax=Azospirillum brasilense TaxID=192 RepID=UPI0010BFB774|nr:hypothetical protein [Azospirillum brasilense]